MAGYIKLHRDIMNWEWYKDIPVRILFEHCILKANYEAKKWQGKVIERGQFVTSLKNLAFETGLTLKQVRTAINKLKKTNEMAHEGHSQYSIITIKNWDKFQQEGTQEGTQRANEGHAEGKQRATTKEMEEYKEVEEREEVVDEIVEKEKQKNSDNFYGEFGNVFLTKRHYDTLYACILDEVILKELIEELSSAIARKSERYKLYDEKYPDAHFLYLKAFWRQKKEHPEKFLPKNAADTGGKSYTEQIKRGIELGIAKGVIK